jgi:uncharacterized delta-60 repeat protein
MGRRRFLAGVACAVGLASLSTALAAPGQLDSGFGAGGKVRTDIGRADWASAVAIAPNGAVVLAGSSDADVAVARYDAAGRLDPSFGGRGTVVTDLGEDDSARALVVQSDGKILVGGQRGSDLALARYSVDGTLDPGFGRDGLVVTDLGDEERALALLLRPDGRLIVVGSRSDGLILTRYLPDGRLDAGFGRGGTVVTPTPGLDWRTAAAGRDGRIVVAGARIVKGPAQAMALAIARYRSDGRLDRSFAGDGLNVMSARRHWAGAIHVAVRSDGRIVIGTHGHAGAGVAGFALVQLRRDGLLDPAFGKSGIAVSNVGYGVHALALDRRGRIVTAGRTTSLLDFVVARFLPDGRRDRTFTATVTDFGGIDTPFWLTLQPDGKIVVAGACGTSGTSLVGDFAVARYLSSG